MEDVVGTSEIGRLSPIPEICKELLNNELLNVVSVEIETHKGKAGRPLRTSPVPFLPKAGLELMLKDPLLMSVEFRKIC